MCAAIQGNIGLGGSLSPPPGPPMLFYEHFPLWLRVGGWWCTAALAGWAAARKTHVPVPVVGLMLMLMPLERLVAFLLGGHLRDARITRGSGLGLVQRRVLHVHRERRGDRRSREGADERSREGLYVLGYLHPLLWTLQAGPDWQTIAFMIVGGLSLAGSINVGARFPKSSKEANDTAKDSQALAKAKTTGAEKHKMRAEHTAERKCWEQEREEDRQERERDHREREDLRSNFGATTRLFTMSVGYIEEIIRHIRSGGGEPLPEPSEDLRAYLAHLFDHKDT